MAESRDPSEPRVEQPCPGCGRVLRIRISLAGQWVECNSCGRRFLAAGPEAAPSPAPAEGGRGPVGLAGGEAERERRPEDEARGLREQLEATHRALEEARAEAARRETARLDAVAEAGRERADALRRADDARREAEAEIARQREASRRDREGLTSEVESLGADLCRLRESSAAEREAALEARDRAWSDRLASARAEADGRLATAEADVRRLEGEAADAVACLERATIRSDELAREAARLARELEEARSSLVEARAAAADVPALRDELGAARRRGEALAADLAEARREVDRLREESDRSARALDEAADAARQSIGVSEAAWSARLDEAGRRREADLVSAREQIDGLAREAEGFRRELAAEREASRAAATRQEADAAGPPDVARQLRREARALHASGDVAGARALMTRAVYLMDSSTDAVPGERAAALNVLACLAAELGDRDEARGLFERALRVCRESLAADRGLEQAILSNAQKTAAAGMSGFGGVIYT